MVLKSSRSCSHDSIKESLVRKSSLTTNAQFISPEKKVSEKGIQIWEESSGADIRIPPPTLVGM